MNNIISESESSIDMCTLIIRNRHYSGNGILNLSKEVQDRAKKHLKSVGYDIDRIQPLIWPEDAISAYRRSVYEPWQFTTKSDILKRKRQDMEQSLWFKREYGVIQKRPLYVWVFWCPGISGIYEGWWIYLIGRGISTSKYFEGSKLCSKVMELFPIIEPTIFDIEQDWQKRERWMIEFARRYQRGYWCGKPQGKAPIWAEIKGNRIERILGRAEWPDLKGR